MSRPSIYRDSTYLEHNPTWHTEDSPWKARQVMKMLDRHGLQPRRVAEVGCGAGEILNQLYNHLPEGTSFTGFEVSPQAIELARSREKPGLHFELADLLEDERTFDLLLVIDVFEHVPDYMGFLERLRPRAEWAVFHIPLDLSAQTVLRESSLLHARTSVGHLHYFTEGTALATLRDTGYEVVDYFFTARSIELAGGGWKRRLARLPRKSMAAWSPSLASRLLGGFSLLVLTRR